MCNGKNAFVTLIQCFSNFFSVEELLKWLFISRETTVYENEKQNNREEDVSARRLLQYFQSPDKNISLFGGVFIYFFAVFQNSYVFIYFLLYFKLVMYLYSFVVF